ncbi:agmatinase [Candidatus Woesearchaeota archaeon]|nr:agmatinase [Candidatus Woesearchaeota archaeon]
MNPTYGGFLDTEDTAKVVILPIPYDGTSTWMKGADKGPNALLDASCNLEFYDIETDSEVYIQGIATADPVLVSTSPDAMVDASTQRVRDLLGKDKFVVCLGGEHSVSVGPIRAYKEKYPCLSVLQFDAHTDLRQSYEGSIYNHACVMARVKEICPIVQVGIRSMDSSEKQDLVRERVFFAEDIYGRNDYISKVVDLLTDDVYITIDLDVFDHSIMPSTGTPEPGGMLWYDVLSVIKEVVRRKNLVGFDIVELCPSEQNRSPDFLAAKLLYKVLSYRFGGSEK